MTASDLQSRLLERLGDTASGEYVVTGYYTGSEALNWLNAAERIFVLLTLCLENTQALDLAPNQAFYSMMGQYSDWLLPLRVRMTNGGPRLKPARLSDLAANDASWSVSPGTPDRYALLGFDLLAIYQQPIEAISIDITYASCPPLLVNPVDVPAIPAAYHPMLVEGAIPLCRAKEGGGEFQKVLGNWDVFLDAAGKLGEYVRARNKEQGYDRMPAELKRFDRSKLLMQQVKVA
jgi:hypothetical protein